MATETLTISQQKVKTAIEFYWSKTWADIHIKHEAEGDFGNRILIAVNPEVLRTIADQFYTWAETLEEERQPGPQTEPVRRAKQ